MATYAAHCSQWRNILNSTAASQLGALCQLQHTKCEHETFSFKDCFKEVTTELEVPKLLLPLLKDKRIVLYRSRCCLPAKEKIYNWPSRLLNTKSACNEDGDICDFHNEHIRYYAITFTDVDSWGPINLGNQLPRNVVEKILKYLDDLNIDAVFNMLKMRMNSVYWCTRYYPKQISVHCKKFQTLVFFHF